MDKQLFIAPSTDPAHTYDELKVYVKEIAPYADFLHCDVMDGVFVARKTIDYNIIKKISTITTIPLDVHLMIKNPEKYIKKYKTAGAVNITVHYECFKNKTKLIRCLKNITKLGIMCGISIKPTTQVSEIRDLLSFIDIILVMSVEPGKSGQSFIEDSLLKIKELDRIKNDYNAKFLIEVDGGINSENAKNIIDAGADILVSGSYVFNSENKPEAISLLKTK